MAVPEVKAIIFDCFGVLYLDNKQSLLSIVPPEKHAELTDLFLSNNYGYFDRAEYLNRIVEITGKPKDEIVQYIASEHRLNKELIALISDTLKPRYKIGLLSNIGREWIQDFFTKNELHDLFDEVVLSGEEGIAKPNPAVFELMADRLGLSASQCVMIDDIADNCEGAEISGMSAIHFVSTGQLLDNLSQQNLL